MKKRTFLLAAVATGSALLVGWGTQPPRSRSGSAGLMPSGPGEVGLNGWIKIAADGSVVLAMPRSEMGQGVHTALAMLVAEELDVPLAQVRLIQAGADKIYGNTAMLLGGLPFHPSEKAGPIVATKVRVGEWMVAKLARELDVNATGGSSSVADGWLVLRQAAAAARGALLGAAALAWGLPAAQLLVRDGLITHPSGKSGHFGEFAQAAASLPPIDMPLKARQDWKLIGTPAPRSDVPGKVFGTAQFGIDVRRPGQLYAVMRHAPQLGGSPARLDVDAILRSPGVSRVVNLPAYAGGTAGFAVVGNSYWSAKEAAYRADVVWSDRPAGALDSAQIAAQLAASAKAGGGFTFYERGTPWTDAQAAGQSGADVLRAAYSAPYLAHATLEPQNCTVHITGDKVEVWAPTQVPQLARAAAARVAGVPIENVVLHVTLLGGGFGRRLEVDSVCQAVRVAMDCGGLPVQLIWPREEDTTHDFYRPAQHAEFVAAKDASGTITHLQISSAGDAVSPRWMKRNQFALDGPFDTPDKTASEGLFDMLYDFANQKVSHVATKSDVPIGFWRSVGHSHNAFFSESMVDELAHWVGKDPVAFRLQYLGESPRGMAVLKLAAKKAGWGKPLGPGVAQGVALHESFGSIVAQVVEVALKPRADLTKPLAAQIEVRKVVCAIDCGTVVNPGTVAQQMEGSVVFALTAALYGRIDIKNSQVLQNNFQNYPLLKLAQAPVVETYIVQSDAPPGGVGEPGVPPVAPALTNALYVLAGAARPGARVRALPLV